MENRFFINVFVSHTKQNERSDWLNSLNAQNLTKGIKQSSKALLSAGLIASMLMTAGCNNTTNNNLDDTTAVETTTAPETTAVKQLLENYDPNYECDFISDLGVQLAQTDNYKDNMEMFGKSHLMGILDRTSVSYTPAGYFKSLGISDDNINYNTGVRADLVTDDSLYLFIYSSNNLFEETADYAKYEIIEYQNLPKELIDDLIKQKQESVYNYANLVRAISETRTPKVITSTYVLPTGGVSKVKGTGENITVESAGVVVDENGKKVIYAIGKNINGQPVLAKSVTNWEDFEKERLKELNQTVSYPTQTTNRFQGQENYEIIDEGLLATNSYGVTSKYLEPANNIEKTS